jgi:hypothetical protein
MTICQHFLRVADRAGVPAEVGLGPMEFGGDVPGIAGSREACTVRFRFYFGRLHLRVLNEAGAGFVKFHELNAYGTFACGSFGI